MHYLYVDRVLAERVSDVSERGKFAEFLFVSQNKEVFLLVIEMSEEGIRKEYSLYGPISSAMGIAAINSNGRMSCSIDPSHLFAIKLVVSHADMMEIMEAAVKKGPTVHSAAEQLEALSRSFNLDVFQKIYCQEGRGSVDAQWEDMVLRSANDIAVEDAVEAGVGGRDV